MARTGRGVSLRKSGGLARAGRIAVVLRGVCASGEEGAVASVEGLNEFLDGWVCESLRNGTTYFW